MKIVLCQTPIIWESANDNIDHYNKVLKDIFKNNGSGIDLVIFPELFTYGFTLNHNIYEDLNGPSSVWIREKSKEYNVAIVATVPVKENEQTYNRAIFYTPDGTIHKYDKRHLFSFGGEDKAFKPGNSRTIIKYKGWNIFLQICYDLRFPVWSRNCDLSYDLIINMASWPSTREGVVNPLVRARAIENLCYFAFVNRSGEDPGNSYNMIGLVSDFKGEEVDTLFLSKEYCYQIYELNHDDLLSFRDKFRVWEDADDFTLKTEK